MTYKVYCDDSLLLDTRLSDTGYSLINPKVDLELNKAGTFTFDIYDTHINFEKLNKLKSIIQVYQDDFLLFRGRILNDETGFFNQKKITCEGELAFLNDSIQRPYDFKGTPEAYLRMLINSHNEQVDTSKQFVIGEVTVTDGDTSNTDNQIIRSDSEYKPTWAIVEEKLIKSLGGYIYIDFDDNGNRRINYLADFDTLNIQKIKYGENLLDINRVVKGEDIVTAIIPLGEKDQSTGERLTIKAVNNDIDFIYDEAAVAKYGYIFKTVVWDNVTTASNLLTKAKVALADAINLTNSIEISAVDKINTFRIGTYVKVESIPHDIDMSLLIQKMSLSILNPKSNKLTLGTTYSSFTEQTIEANKEYRANTQTIINERIDESLYEVESELYSAIQQSSTSVLNTVAENYYLKDQTDVLIESLQSEVKQTSDSLEISISKFEADIDSLKNGGIDSVTTSTGFTFNKDGLSVSKTGSEMTTTITEDGMTVKKDNNVVLTANNTGVDAVNLHASTYLIVGKNSRFEDYLENRTGCFWVGE